MKKRVVVTGIGTINPLGNNSLDTWRAATKGISGIDKISLFDASDLRCQIAGEVKGLDASKVVSAKELPRMPRFLQLAMVATHEAMIDSDILIDDEIAPEVGVSIGSGIGGLTSIEQSVLLIEKKGVRRLSPFFIPMTIANSVSGCVSIKYRTKGYNASIASACATSNHAIGDATNLIRSGQAKVMITGGTEGTICKIGVGGFDAMRALSTRNDTPKTASRPYDQDRDGFVMGEGCGILVLEELEFAKKRNAKIYCEVIGYGFSSDASHITMPTVDGPTLAINKALKNANISGVDVDYVNAHGTSTPLGDINELKAISKSFGEDGAKKVSISSSKSMMGHLLGGAGGVESILTIMAMKDSFVPPTINVFNLDKNCDLDITPNEGVERPIKIAMNNSFGFGGTNATLIFKEFS
ncbi:MAG: beta-ketoacyl-ACP synthase II [SAR324 cluster bacterium]|nr:beta-ketoacyl-ACP synthase II [SAR324 cluster bacterium]